VTIELPRITIPFPVTKAISNPLIVMYSRLVTPPHQIPRVRAGVQTSTEL